jgi:hypothetical protein
MGGIDFFGAREDLLALVDWVAEETDFRIYESSHIGGPCRRFVSAAALDKAARVGKRSIVLALWSPSVTRNPGRKRLRLDPDAKGVRMVRHELSGFGLAQLALGATARGVVALSSFGHNSRARASNWGGDGGIAWPELERLGGRVRRYIRSVAVAKAGTTPVLPRSAALAKGGFSLKLHWTAPHAFGPLVSSAAHRA